MAGVVALLIIVPAVYWGFTKSNPFADRFEFKAAFETGNDVKQDSLVRIAGVTVGKVKKVEPVAKGDPGVVLTMEVEKAGLPIHKDAQLKVRPRIFLEGNFFVDVKPGSPSAPVLKEGETIPVQQTQAPVQFGQVLTALQTDTREDLRKVLDEYGRGLSGEGAKGYNRSIPYQESAFRNSAIVNEAQLGQRDHDLSDYVEGAGRFAEGLDRNRRQLKALITDFADTAEGFADEDVNLARAIDELPDLLTTGRSALGALNESFPPTRRLIADLRPATRSSLAALTTGVPLTRQLRGLVSRPELRGLVRDLRPVVPNLVELNRGGVGLQGEIRALASCQLEVYLPTLEEKIPDPNIPAPGKVYEEAPKPLVGLAGESRSYDANGPWARVLAKGANYAYAGYNGNFTLTGAPVQGVNPPKKQGQLPPPLRPDVPCETQERPDLRTRIQEPPQAIRVNQSSPAARARYEQAKEYALGWTRRLLRTQGEKLKVRTRELTRPELARIGKGRR
jgi:virulence factor Mce-like protein